jgi:hypothetical protein
VIAVQLPMHTNRREATGHRVEKLRQWVGRNSRSMSEDRHKDRHILAIKNTIIIIHQQFQPLKRSAL